MEDLDDIDFFIAVEQFDSDELDKFLRAIESDTEKSNKVEIGYNSYRLVVDLKTNIVSILPEILSHGDINIPLQDFINRVKAFNKRHKF